MTSDTNDPAEEMEALDGEVLDFASVTPPPFATPIAEQSAALMVEDVRAYLQGSEQIIMAAMGQAFAQILAGDDTNGTNCLTAITTAVGTINTFTTNSIACAQSVTDGS